MCDIQDITTAAWQEKQRALAAGLLPTLGVLSKAEGTRNIVLRLAHLEASPPASRSKKQTAKGGNTGIIRANPQGRKGSAVREGWLPGQMQSGALCHQGRWLG